MLLCSYEGSLPQNEQFKIKLVLYTPKCKICPEHKMKANNCDATIVLDNNKGEIVCHQCLDFVVSAGGCKYPVAFLMWTYQFCTPASAPSYLLSRFKRQRRGNGSIVNS